jgi:hypothetical protein
VRKGSEGIGFSGESRAGTYQRVEQLPVAQEYGVHKKRPGTIRKRAEDVSKVISPSD